MSIAILALSALATLTLAVASFCTLIWWEYSLADHAVLDVRFFHFYAAVFYASAHDRAAADTMRQFRKRMLSGANPGWVMVPQHFMYERRTNKAGGRFTLVVFPLWVPFLVFAIYPTIVFLRSPYCFRRRYRRKLGLCVRCGYDLTGLAEPRCPECGTPYGPPAPKGEDAGSENT